MADSLEENIFSVIDRQWIEPELHRRYPNGIPSDFKLLKALIKLPIGEAPVVLFNDEVGFRGVVRVNGPISVGDEVKLHQLNGPIERVEPITHNGRRVAFALLLYTGPGGVYTVIFDARPNIEGYTPEPDEEWKFSAPIAEYLTDQFKARSIGHAHAHRRLLWQAGLWEIPCLCPNPLALIIDHLAAGRANEAETVLQDSCNTAFLRERVLQWSSVPAFQSRESLFQQCLACHERGEYAPVVYTLTPQYEGIISDWLLSKSSGGVPRGQREKLQAFESAVAARTRLRHADLTAVDGVAKFIMHGGPMQSFVQWTDPINFAFPSRHSVAHGRTDPAMFTKLTCIKAFLLLDTLWHTMDAERLPASSMGIPLQ
jgi:hypothetical protein